MTKLTDTQLVILSTACGRDGRAVFPVSASLKGGALNKVLQSLLARGYVEEVPAEAGAAVWRDEEEGPLTLRATHAAAVALGVEPEPETPGPAETAQAAEEPNGVAEAATSEAPTEPAGGPENAEAADAPAEPSSAPTEPAAGHASPKVRAGTKQALLIEMLRRAEGTTIDEVMAATGWQGAHRPRRHGGRAQEEAGAGGDVGEGRGQGTSVSDRPSYVTQAHQQEPPGISGGSSFPHGRYFVFDRSRPTR
jgi:hypothetical protein